ncbi:MAG: hypothetical protein Q8L59_11160 [Phenylobacterium sp.]|uniref:hypothetical protein n=1 Tax=Phenylobacterium sp. TaxID=1871053 RepID=UPI002737734A|nr:hypothetical protein [Phenylobacterium sp.]MDP1642733.1 hypothetical protein [Phenylobacterium sp.]MDP3117219.1 hypothetical protein [Phenylobacterium sp.]
MVLTTDQLAALRSAARVAELGRRRVAEAIVGHVQRELGVSPDLHAQAIGAAADKVARIQRDQRARRVGQVRRQVITANRTVAAPAPTPEVQKALQSVGEALDRLRATRQTARNAREALVRSKALSPTERAELAEHANRARTANWAALALMRERSIAAEQLRRAQLDAFWAQTAEAETAELAQARGEVIGASRDAESSRALRISSRDGLATLFEAGAITAHQYGAGRAYRVAFEAAGVIRVASLNPDGPAGGRAQPSGLQARSAHELQRAYVLARLRQIELAVSGLGDRELNVLRKVAGEARTIRELGGGGNTREANQAALRRALEAAVRVLAGPVHLGLKRAAGR